MDELLSSYFDLNGASLPAQPNSSDLSLDFGFIGTSVPDQQPNSTIELFNSGLNGTPPSIPVEVALQGSNKVHSHVSGSSKRAADPSTKAPIKKRQPGPRSTKPKRVLTRIPK
jgi:hypothetical protein